MTRRIPSAPSKPPTSGVKDETGSYMSVSSPTATPEVFRLDKILFDQQLRFVMDPHSFKVAVCSRRSGKTVACAAHLIDTALKTADVVCLYITLSRNNAKKLIWRELKKLIGKYKIKAVPDQTELSWTFENGSVIYCSGAKDDSEIEKFRGLPIKLCYIDECQSFREYIRDLVDDVIAPALLDHAGDLCLIGTPGAIPSGYFAEVCGQVPDRLGASESWTNHHWTFFDNPHFPAVLSGKYTHQQLLNRELKRRGVDMSDPSIQREWFGKWVLDTESLWIKYYKDKNHYDFFDAKAKKYNYILGIDLGFNDADALAVLAWSEDSPVTYLVHEVVTPKQGLTELVDQIKTVQALYPISKMVIDEGGLGKKLAEEMRRRHGLPVEAADKARKQENVAFLNDALRTGRFKAKSGSKFAQDTFLVEIDRSKSRPDKIKISDKYHSDIIDAVLYAFKLSPAYAFQVPEEPAQPGTPEWSRQQQDGMFDDAMKHFQEQADLEKLISGG